MSFARHRRLAAVAALVALLAWTRSGQADPADLSRLSWIFDGAVQTSARVGDVLYVGGTFEAVAPSASVVPPVYALAAGSGALAGPTFPFASQGVAAVLQDGTGGYFLAGAVTVIGAATPAPLVHVLSDGTVDSGFTPTTITGTPTGMARVGNTLYLIGTFTVPAPRFYAYVVAVSAIDGSAVNWTSGLDPMLPAAIVAGTDRVVVLGTFGDSTQSSGVAAALDAGARAPQGEDRRRAAERDRRDVGAPRAAGPGCESVRLVGAGGRHPRAGCHVRRAAGAERGVRAARAGGECRGHQWSVERGAVARALSGRDRVRTGPAVADQYTGATRRRPQSAAGAGCDVFTAAG